MVAQPVGDVLRHTEVWEQCITLEHHVHRALVGGHPGHRLPGQQHLAGAGLVEAGDHPQGGGLATAGTAVALHHVAELDIDELACVAHGRPLVPGVPGMWPQASYGGFRLYISLGG
ncbi:hypothetical protein D3C77_568150 [compost metagenome]